MKLLRIVWVVFLLGCTVGFGLCGGWGVYGGLSMIADQMPGEGTLFLLPGVFGVGIALFCAFVLYRSRNKPWGDQG